MPCSTQRRVSVSSSQRRANSRPVQNGTIRESNPRSHLQRHSQNSCSRGLPFRRGGSSRRTRVFPDFKACKHLSALRCNTYETSERDTVSRCTIQETAQLQRPVLNPSPNGLLNDWVPPANRTLPSSPFPSGFDSPSTQGGRKDNAVFVHVDGQLPLYDQANMTSLEWVDAFVKAFDQTHNAKTSTLTLFVGGPFDKKDLSPVSGGEAFMQGGYSFLQPIQSAESSVSDSSATFIVLRRLQGVVRRDAFARLRDFAFFHQGSYSTIPLDRLLADVAYKIGCAKKYGA